MTLDKAAVERQGRQKKAADKTRQDKAADKGSVRQSAVCGAKGRQI